MNPGMYIPLGAKRVLELGCGRGEGGESYLRRHPGAEYWGVECDLQKVKDASARVSHGFTLFPQEAGRAALERGGFFGQADAIVVQGEYATAMTAERLGELAEMLSEEGQLLMLVENPAYLPRLLAAFGGQSLAAGLGEPLAHWLRLLQEAGLSVYQVRGLRPGGEAGKAAAELLSSQEGKAFREALAGLLQKSGREVRLDMGSMAFLVRAGRKEVQQPRLALHAMEGEALVTARIRVEEPFAALVAEPLVECRFEKGTLNAAADDGCQAKICLRQRLSYADLDTAEQQLAWLKERGYLAVYEIDDNPILWKEENDRRKWADFRLSHAVQVSTEPLAEVIRQYNPEVVVFRNELAELPAARNFEQELADKLAAGGDYVTLFFGALNRDNEWQDIMPALNEAAKKYGSGLRFKVLADRAFFDALETSHKEFVGREDFYGGRYVPYEVYIATLRSADIALLPLHDTPFNRTKSDLKFIESAGHGAVVLASPTVYEDTVRHGRTGFIYRSPEEFASYLQLLVEDRARRLETAKAAYAYVQEERLLCHHYRERLDWYRRLWERREELEQGLQQRLKEIREE